MKGPFRLVWRETFHSNKFDVDSENTHELYGNGRAIYRLWILLTRYGHAYVDVYNLNGELLDLKNRGMLDAMKSHCV